VRLVVDASTREIEINREPLRNVHMCMGIAVADRVDGGSGVVVIRVQPGGLAARVGVQLGDTILAVDGALVASHKDAIERIDAAPTIFRLTMGPSASADLPRLLDALQSTSAEMSPPRRSPSSKSPSAAQLRYTRHACSDLARSINFNSI